MVVSTMVNEQPIAEVVSIAQSQWTKTEMLNFDVIMIKLSIFRYTELLI